MKVLVTGANGFLGREVVAALAADGHAVRALVRPATDVTQLRWGSAIEVARADLRGGTKLEPLLAGVEAVVHLATQMTGEDFTILAGTLLGSERLFDAMASAGTRRLVLCSSFSVYDWLAVGGTLGDDGPLPADIWPSGAYAAAKHWQERLARRMADQHGWKLTVLRPGFVWGRGNDELACIGQRLGRHQLVFGPLRELALTHATNCADAFRFVLGSEAALGKTLNVVDGQGITAARYARVLARGKLRAGRRLWVPYRVARIFVGLANLGSRLVFGPRYKLPSMFAPVRFDLRFKPVRARSGLRALGWQPPKSFEECVRATFGPKSALVSVPGPATESDDARRAA